MHTSWQYIVLVECCSFDIGEEDVLLVRHVQESSPVPLPLNVIFAPSVCGDRLREDLGFFDVESLVDPAQNEGNNAKGAIEDKGSNFPR